MNNTAALIFGCSIIFVATTLGATIVFFLKREISKSLNCIICGFSAGVMIAASVFGLLLPAIEQSSSYGKFAFLPSCIGILVGCLFLHFIDFICKIINKKSNNLHLSNEKIKLTRFVVAFTVHNIPEGMAVGFALGNALNLSNSGAMLSALMLAIGIAVQNIPEGAAVALPVYKATKSKAKGFLWGMLSGIVEPLFAALGVLLATSIASVLPWTLSFSAGAMLFVSVEDLIPEACNENSHLGSWSVLVGFVLMMALDIALG